MFFATNAWYCSSHRIRKGSRFAIKKPRIKEPKNKRTKLVLVLPLLKNKMEAIRKAALKKSGMICLSVK